MSYDHHPRVRRLLEVCARGQCMPQCCGAMTRRENMLKIIMDGLLMLSANMKCFS